MGIEIERKFLVLNDDWRSLGEPISYSQGYLVADGMRTVRIRTAGSKGYLTIKGGAQGISRMEYEYEVPFEEAIELFRLCVIPVITKFRTNVLFAGKIWEVDEFEGDNKGLIMAEIELESEDEDFLLPSWMGPEVTGDPRYYNSSLARNPFKNW